MDASSHLDVSRDLVAEIPTKQTLNSPRSLSQDVIKHLGIVTVKQDRADAATKKVLILVER